MVQVKVEEGILQGEILESQLGTKYYSFKGIPYAQPPVGELRFKAPQSLKSWDGVRSAKEHGSTCIQFELSIKQIIPGSEDCLYLNVYTKEIKPKRALPVMFWIHGGGFQSGNGNSDIYGPDLLIEKDVILVTINYRLEVLGFLCLDTEDVPGNAGLKDQVAALRWVHNNIHNFGGDPNNVTIFGESAGSASVGYHLVSPMSKGLFKRAILQSGTPSSGWARGFELRERALQFAKKLGHISEDDKELYNFFKSLPVEKLVNANVAVNFYEEMTKHQAYIYWVPVEENKFGNNERFYYGNCFDVVRDNIDADVEIIIGCTADEGAFIIGLNLESTISNYNEYIHNFVPLTASRHAPISKHIQIARKIKDHFFGKSTQVTKENVKKLLHYASMDMFVYDIIEWSKLCAHYGYKVYLYNFNYKGDRNFMSGLAKFQDVFGFPVASHADELGYLFTTAFQPPINKAEKSFQIIERMTNLWTNFAKYGNPTPDNSLNVKWTPFTLKNQEYLKITDTLKMDHHMFKEDIDFFQNLYREYIPSQCPELKL